MTSNIPLDQRPRCLFCDERPVGYFDSTPPQWDEWCGVCPVGVTYEQYLDRKVRRVLGYSLEPSAP